MVDALQQVVALVAVEKVQTPNDIAFKPAPKRRVILNMHGIGAPARELEPGEGRYWVEPEFFAQVVALADRFRDQAEVSFSFDDGNRSDLKIGAQVLARFGFSASFYVLADRINKPGSLDAEDLCELREMGHEIGSHGAAHVDWTRQDRVGLEVELVQARDIIATILREPVVTAAIPFGRYNRHVLRALRTHGYEKVYSSDGGAWHSGQYPIPRTSLTATTTTDQVEAVIRGGEGLKTRLRREAGRAFKRYI